LPAGENEVGEPAGVALHHDDDDAHAVRQPVEHAGEFAHLQAPAAPEGDVVVGEVVAVAVPAVAGDVEDEPVAGGELGAGLGKPPLDVAPPRQTSCAGVAPSR
jgi:hypothetical protein